MNCFDASLIRRSLKIVKNKIVLDSVSSKIPELSGEVMVHQGILSVQLSPYLKYEKGLKKFWENAFMIRNCKRLGLRHKPTKLDYSNMIHNYEFYNSLAMNISENHEIIKSTKSML